MYTRYRINWCFMYAKAAGDRSELCRLFLLLVLEEGLYTLADVMAHGPMSLIDCCSLFQSVHFSYKCEKTQRAFL